MTTRYTDQEWSSIIAATENVVRPAITQIPKAVPKVDSPQLAQTVDHTLLKLDATKAQIDDLCSEARVAGFASVCVRPNYTQQAVNNVKGTTVKVAVVIGFHTGENDLAQKMAETRHAVSHGALELDVVLNRTHLKAGEYGKVYNELAALRSVAPHPVLIKLILETSQLSDSEIIAAAVIARAVSFDFIKTSTGFLGHGATVEHVRLMSACCEVLGEAAVGGWAGHGLLAEYKNLVTAAGVAVEAPATPLEENAPPRTKTLVHKMQVKASGGVRTLEDAIKMLEAGATRLGTSAGVYIMKEAQEKAETGMVSSSNKNTSDYVRRSHRHGRHHSGHHQSSHSRTNSANSNISPRRPHPPAKEVVTNGQGQIVRPRRSQNDINKSFNVSTRDFAQQKWARPSHSSSQHRHTHHHAPTNRVSLFPSSSSDPRSRSHTRKAHGGSDSVLTRSDRKGMTNGQVDYTQRRMTRTRRPSEPIPPLMGPTAQSSMAEVAPPHALPRRVGSDDLAYPVPYDQLPDDIRRQQCERPQHKAHRRVRSDAQPQYPPRTSSLQNRKRADTLQTQPTPPTHVPSGTPNALLPEPRKSHHVKNQSTSTTTSTASSTSTKTLRKKISLPPAYPGGDKIELVILGDNSRGMWEGNGVVMKTPSLPIQAGNGHRRKPSGHRKVKSVDEARPGMTRLYTDL